MKVKDLIEQLQKYNNPDDDIVCAYWSFSDVDDDSLTDDEWRELVRRFDNHSFYLIPLLILIVERYE